MKTHNNMKRVKNAKELRENDRVYWNGEVGRVVFINEERNEVQIKFVNRRQTLSLNVCNIYFM